MQTVAANFFRRYLERALRGRPFPTASSTSTQDTAAVDGANDANNVNNASNTNGDGEPSSEPAPTDRDDLEARISQLEVFLFLAREQAVKMKYKREIVGRLMSNFDAGQLFEGVPSLLLPDQARIRVRYNALMEEFAARVAGEVGEDRRYENVSRGRGPRFVRALVLR